MIETRARVIAIEPGYAWVECERRSGCSHCSSSDGCGVSSLSKLFGARQLRMRLPDPLGVQRGDDVVIGLSEERLLAAAAAAYMLPLIAMIVVALSVAHLGHGQGVLALSSFAGLATGLWLVKYRANSQRSAIHYQPVILRQPSAGESTIEFETVMKGASHE